MRGIEGKAKSLATSLGKSSVKSSVKCPTKSRAKRPGDAPLDASPTIGTFSARSGPWRTVGVSVASPGHLSAGKGCEDEIQFLERNGVLACALADGAGSRKRCKIGARIAVTEACEELVEHFDDIKKRPRADALIHRINLSLARRAGELQEDTHELASTLAFVAIRGLEFVTGNLGDGIVGCVGHSSGNVLIGPEWGEYANQTFFTTDSVAIEHTRIVQGTLEGDRNTFIMMSDGAVKRLYDFKSRALTSNGVEIASWLFKSNADQVLSSLESFMRTTLAPRANDDCSIILISQVGSSAASSPARTATARVPGRRKPEFGKAKPRKKKSEPKKKALPRRQGVVRRPAEKRLVDRLSKDSMTHRTRSGAWRRIRTALTAMFDWTSAQR